MWISENQIFLFKFQDIQANNRQQDKLDDFENIKIPPKESVIVIDKTFYK